MTVQLLSRTQEPNPPSPQQEPLPLFAGDRLSRAEFERRYHAQPALKKAELIDGIVYMPSPVKYKRHSNPHLSLGGWLTNYLVATPHVEGGDNATVRMDNQNEPQPDLLLRIDRALGGLLLSQRTIIWKAHRN